MQLLSDLMQLCNIVVILFYKMCLFWLLLVHNQHSLAIFCCQWKKILSISSFCHSPNNGMQCCLHLTERAEYHARYLLLTAACQTAGLLAISTNAEPTRGSTQKRFHARLKRPYQV